MKKIYKKNKRIITLFFILIIFAEALSAAMAYCFSFILTSVYDILGAKDGNLTMLWISIGSTICVALFGILFSHFSEKVKATAIKRFNTQLRNQISEKINSMSDSEYDNLKKGDFISWYINDVDMIESITFENFFQIINYLFSIVFGLVLLFIFHWIIALAAILVTLIIVFTPFTLHKYIERKTDQLTSEREVFSKRTENLVNGYKVIAYDNKKNTFTSLLKKSSKRIEKSSFSHKVALSNQVFVLSFASVISMLLLITIAIILAFKGMTEVGAVLGVGLAVSNFSTATSQLFNSIFTLKSGKKVSEKFIGDFKYDENFKPEIEKFESLEVKNLDYKINNKQIFENLNLDIEKDKKYLIVGKSGRGKTTLFKLLFGLIDKYDGDIVLNKNKSYKKIDKKEIKNLIYYLPQESVIFNDTVRNNVSLFNENITDEQIIQALQKVNLKNLLDRFGLDGVISAEASSISGGEMQRIAIARALVREKELIVMDEVTANLDKQNREIIENLIESLNKTILYISHTAKDEGLHHFDAVFEL